MASSSLQQTSSTPAEDLTNFLQSRELVTGDSEGGKPHEILKGIINDDRWSVRMLEDWFKKGPGKISPIHILSVNTQKSLIKLLHVFHLAVRQDLNLYQRPQNELSLMGFMRY